MHLYWHSLILVLQIYKLKCLKYQKLKFLGFSDQVGNIIWLKRGRELLLQMLSVKFSMSHPILFIDLTSFLVLA